MKLLNLFSLCWLLDSKAPENVLSEMFITFLGRLEHKLFVTCVPVAFYCERICDGYEVNFNIPAEINLGDRSSVRGEQPLPRVPSCMFYTHMNTKRIRVEQLHNA